MCGWCVHLCMPTWSRRGHWYPAHSALAYSFRAGSVTDPRSTLVDTKPCLHAVYICYTTGVTDLYGHTQLFIWVLGSKFASSFLHSKLLYVCMCTHKDYTFSQIVEIGFLRGHKENNKK